MTWGHCRCSCNCCSAEGAAPCNGTSRARSRPEDFFHRLKQCVPNQMRSLWSAGAGATRSLLQSLLADEAIVNLEPAALENWKDVLPESAYEEDVSTAAKEYVALQSAEHWFHLFRSHTHREALPLQCSSGPAVVIAWKNLGLVWVSAALLPWVTFFFCYFNPHDSHSYASYPLYLWVPLFVMIWYSLRCEWQCLKYAIVPQLQVVGHFKILWIKLENLQKMKGMCGNVAHLEYWTWVAVTFAISILTHLDVINNGLFLAVTLRTMWSTPHKTTWEYVWGRTIQNSYLHPVFSKFENCVWFAWVLMFLQVIVGVLATIPVPTFSRWTKGASFEYLFNFWKRIQQWQDFSERDIDYTIKNAKYAEDLKFDRLRGDYPTYYQTLADRRSHFSDHGHVLIVLAETGRMASLAAMRDEYIEKKVQYYLTPAAEQLKGPKWAMILIYRLMSRACVRTIFHNVLSSSLTTNLQGSLLSMTFYLDHEENRGKLHLFLIIGVLVHLKNLLREGWRWWLVNRIIANPEHFNDAESKREHRRNKLVVLQCLLFLCLYMYFLMIQYAVFKYAATYFCQDKMWNVSGCVIIDRDMPQAETVNGFFFVAFLLVALVPIILFLAPHIANCSDPPK